MNARNDSYTAGVKEKENNTWTMLDLTKVYTLRERGVSPEDIARQFRAKGRDVSKVEVHNATRRARKLFAGACCQCGNHLTAQELIDNEHRTAKLCVGCRRQQRNYKHDLREKALARGKCGYCGVNDVEPGKCSCLACKSSTHRRRLLQGLCGKCGKHPIRKGGLALCASCAEEMRVAAEEMRAS